MRACLVLITAGAGLLWVWLAFWALGKRAF